MAGEAVKSVEFSVADAKVERGPHYQTYYSNIANIMSGRFDIAITFAEVIGERVIQEKCRIVMHPDQAKLLVEALVTNLENRETLRAGNEQEKS